MSDPLAVFDNWCNEFPNYLVPNDPNLINHLTYFDQVLDYYRGNFILCEPYQKFTNKFLDETVPNALKKLINFPTLDALVLNKIILLFAKYIDLPAQLIIKNIPFYNIYSYIADEIFNEKSNIMTNNKNMFSELQQTVKDYPLSALVEWIKKSPKIDWNMFHFITSYLLFIQKYIKLNEVLNLFLPSFQDLINMSISSPQIISNTMFSLNVLNLFFLLSKDLLQQPFFQSFIYLIIKYIIVSNDLKTINALIIILDRFQNIGNVKSIILKILNDLQFDKLITSSTIPIDKIKCLKLDLLLKMDENLILNAIENNSTKDDQRFPIILNQAILSFHHLNQSQKANFLNKLFNEKDSSSIILQKILLLAFIDEEDSIPISSIDNIIRYFYKSGDLFQLLIQQSFKNSDIAVSILRFMIDHSNEENFIEYLISFWKKNSKYFLILEDNDFLRVLLKDDNNSFNFYFQLIIKSNHKLTIEAFKNVWNQMMNHDERISIFLKYFQRHLNFLFTTDCVHVFINFLMSLDYSKISQNMINLFVDFIYLQEKAFEGKPLDKSKKLQSFTHFGMNELFKCYLSTMNNETLIYVKTQLLNIWNNCDYNVTAERNENLSEFFIKNCTKESNFIRCFSFLNDFVKSDENGYLLEDIGFSHLKDQKELIQKKTLKLKIILTKLKQQQQQQNQNNENDSDKLSGTMFFSPSDLCMTLKSRVLVKFRCKDLTNGRCFGKMLNMNSTLEMDKITDGSIIQFEYSSINSQLNEYQQLQIYMPRMLMNCVPIYQKALDLLHSEKLDNNLAASILEFVYYLPVSFQLLSLLDTIDAISKAINDSLNPYERELFLHVLYKYIDDEKVKKMLVENQFYRNLIDVFNEKELNETGYKRILSILMKIWPESENEEFINTKLHSFISKMINKLMINKETKSRKLINNCADIFLTMNSFNPYQKVINEEIKENIMNIVTNIQWKIFGKIIPHLTNKDEIFNILLPHLDEFSSKEDRCPFFFDAIFASIDTETKNLKTISDLAISHLYNYGISAFSSLCEFINSRPELYSQIDIQLLFNYIEENDISPHVFRLINEIYEKVPEKRDEITKIISNYISIELPEYNISENYVIKKNPLGSGIRNLSNTCYISSALQLLYNSNQFKVSLLKKKDVTVDWQERLQKLFAVKNFGLLPFVDPSSFVENYKMMGEKINISEQQDTAEFLLSILNGLPQELSSMFSGSFTNMVTGIDYTYDSSNSEKFFCLPLDVDGCESLETSLSRYNQFEIVNDYKVSDRKESITVKKASIIQRLPPVLLIQLRRFVYNFKTANREKLNSYFYFPFSIDMSNYCISAKKPENYVLTGFILHSGNADFGHFHYIGYNKKIQQWVDYNDSITFAYQISNLEKDAFGSNFQNLKDSSHTSNQSAYILVYEKAGQIDIELKEDEISNLLRETIKAEQIKMKRISSVMSNDFHNLAINSLNVRFLYNYFTKAMLHMNDIDKCNSVKNRLQSLIIEDNKGFQEVIDLLEKDKIALVSPIIYIKNNTIMHIYIDFLKFVIKNSKNGECYCFVTTFLSCINIFKENPDQAILFAEIGKEILKFPDSLIIAQSQKWHLSFLIVLVTIIQNVIKTDDYKYIDIDLFFEDLILMAPIIEKEQKELIDGLGHLMNYFKPKTRNLYKDLSFALSSL